MFPSFNVCANVDKLLFKQWCAVDWCCGGGLPGKHAPGGLAPALERMLPSKAPDNSERPQDNKATGQEFWHQQAQRRLLDEYQPIVVL